MTLDCKCNRLREAEEKAAKWDALVRCWECKHYDKIRGACWHFGYLEMHRDYSWSKTPVWVDPECFCFYGERREA